MRQTRRPGRLQRYPVQAINWADRAGGPSIAQAKTFLKPAICAGINNLTTLPQGTPPDIKNEVTDALACRVTGRIMITPGCTYDPGRVPTANLRALADAVHSLQS